MWIILIYRLLCACENVEITEICCVWAEGSTRRQCTLAMSLWTHTWCCPWPCPPQLSGWQVKPGAGFLEEHPLPKRVKWVGVPHSSIIQFISVSVLASELRSCTGRSQTTHAWFLLCQAAVSKKKKKKKISWSIWRKKSQQIWTGSIYFFLPLSAICA